MGSQDSATDKRPSPPEGTQTPYDETLHAPPPSLSTERTGPPSAVAAVGAPSDGGLRAWPTIPEDHYDLGEEFARGGIGRITRARDRRLDRIVAIKELKRSTRYTQLRFAREVHITARLQHPNIIPVHEAGKWPSGELFFAMKLVDGGSLEDAIDDGGSLEERLRLVRHVAAVAEAMAYAHARHTVHRDLKPSNVLLGPFGETVVIDWGLAKDLSEPDVTDLAATPISEDLPEQIQTTDGVVLGTPPYMAPEQARGETVDERADVYSLGALLYHVISGRVPYYEHHPREIVNRVVHKPPTPLDELEPEVPPDLLAVVTKAMARDADERYAGAGAMVEELRAFLDGGLVDAYSYSTTELIERFVARQRTAVMTGLLGVVALVIGGTWSFANIAEQRNRAEDARGKAERLAELEGKARQEAVDRLDQSILNAARSAVDVDPTYALALLKTLTKPIAGAATVAADASERGVARHVLSAHDDRIDALAISPDGKLVATAGWDEHVALWTRDGAPGAKLDDHDGRVSALAFSPDGSTLASAGYDHVVRLWDQRAADALELKGHAGPIRGIAFDPSGKHLATVGEDAVRLWDVAAKTAQVATLPSDRSLFATWSPDGRHLVTGSHNGTLRVWPSTLDEEPVVLKHDGEVKAAAFSPDSERILSASADGRTRLWTLAGKRERAFEDHEGSVEAIAWMPDGRAFVSGGLDGTVVLRAVDGSTSRRLTRHDERITALAITGDGAHVAAASWDKSISLYDRRTQTTQSLLGHRDVVAALAFTSDDQMLATASWDRTLRYWPIRAPTRQTLSGHAIGVKAVAFSPDGKLVASGGHDDRVRLWDAKTGAQIRTFVGHEDHVFRVIFSPKGDWIASSSDDQTVRLWRVDGSDERAFGGHRADVEELAFSPDGALLASAGEDDVVGLWNVAKGDGRLLTGHEGAVTSVAFSPDGKQLASGSRDGTIRLWDRDGNAVRTLRGEARSVTDIAYAPDGKTIAAANGADDAMLWPATAGEPRLLKGSAGATKIVFSPRGERVAVTTSGPTILLCPLADGVCRPLLGHGSTVHALAFNLDGSCLVSASSDGTLRVWDLDSGESRPLRGHSAPVFGLALSPDQRIASGSGDTTVRLWPLEKPPRRDDLLRWLSEATQHRVDAAN
jgi:eukaryotic-like serine/threonine-protein kinase